jgi:hypothetical protein
MGCVYIEKEEEGKVYMLGGGDIPNHFSLKLVAVTGNYLSTP